MRTAAIDKPKFFAEIGHVPHSGQLQYHDSTVRFKVAVCGRRYGKSTMSARDMEPELFQPNKWFWIVGPSYDLGEKEFRIIWDDLMIRKGLIHDKRIKKSYNVKGGSMYIEFPWRTRLEVRSAQHPESLVGEGLDGVILAEAAKHKRETWERFVRPALADKRGWADFTTTPEGQNWVYTLWQLGQNPAYPDYESWQMPSWENTHVYPGGRQDDEIVLLERTSSPEWFLQEIAADFSAFVGKIFKSWDEQTNVQPLTYNPAWPNYIAWDWGFVNPLAAIEFQVDPFDNIYIWREHYKSYLSLDEHFEEMAGRHQPEGYKITNSFGDAADPEATLQVNQKFCPCISLPEAKENWREGVDEVNKFLKLRPTGKTLEDGTAELKPKLFVDHSCVNTIREFGSYKGKAPTGGRNPMDPIDKAQRYSDHAMDAIRYAIMHLYKLGATYSLSDVMDLNVNRYKDPVRPDRQPVTTAAQTGGIFTMGIDF